MSDERRDRRARDKRERMKAITIHKGRAVGPTTGILEGARVRRTPLTGNQRKAQRRARRRRGLK